MNGLYPKRLDWFALITILILIITSVSFIFSAQFKSAEMMGTSWLKQAIFGLIGLGVYITLVWIDYKYIAQFSWWIYAGAIVLLLAVFLFPPVSGAQRWIQLPGLMLQPSELAKVALTIKLAAFLSSPDKEMDTWKTFFSCAAIAGLPWLLVASQPDLSSSLVMVPITLSIMLYMGIKRKFILICIASMLVLGTLICTWIRFESTPAIEALPKEERPAVVLPPLPIIQDYQKGRIKVFLFKDHDLAGSGWNKLQSQISVGSGGIKGKGFLKGTQNILGFLPRTVAKSDFIFCVIAEESGFIGGLGILSLYSVLLGRCLRTSVRSRDEFGRMISLGIGVMLFCHVFVNIAMTIGILPITGLPLPLMSYGGTFLVTTLIALGLVQSVYHRRSIR